MRKLAILYNNYRPASSFSVIRFCNASTGSKPLSSMVRALHRMSMMTVVTPSDWVNAAGVLQGTIDHRFAGYYSLGSFPFRCKRDC
jgi:hypothetical protein